MHGCNNKCTHPKERKYMSKRNEMLKLRKKLWTLDMIGKKYGISKQRVHQIIGRTGSIIKMIEKRQGVSGT